MATPSFMKGEYTKPKDEKKDKAMLKKAGLDKEQKEEFEKKDKAHGKKKKPATIAEDRKKDDAIIKKIKAKEGKKGEKAEDKREKKKK